MKVWKVCVATVALAILSAATVLAQAQATGVVVGTVTDAREGAPLQGALVRIDGTSIVAATDRDGAFRLVGVPVGTRQLVVSFLGRTDAAKDINVRADATVTVPMALDMKYKESVTVVGDSFAEGDARALNQQRTALNITNVISADQIGSFPDPNAAEAASRIPGVSITRDQGEGRYIMIRGTEPRLNAVMIDGERIPSPEDTRQVMLDVVPADQLQSIQVSKAVTPDMDADSIGGAVNLITRQATSRPTALFAIGGGYNALQKNWGQRSFSGTLGRRFVDGRVGLLAGFSGSQLNRGSEDFEPAYVDGNLDDLQLRDYQIKRERYGANVSADVRTGDHSSLTFKTILNEFKDYEINNRLRYRPANRRLEHVLKNRHQSDTVRSFSASGAQVLPTNATVEYKLSFARSEEKQPDRLDTIFRQTNINFSPNVSATSIDPKNIQPNPSANVPANARLNAWETEIFSSVDRDITGSADVTMPLGSTSGRASFLKFGVKVKGKHKTNDLLVQTASPTGTVPFAQLEDPSFDNSRFLDFFPAGYPKFPGIDPAKSRALFNSLPASSIEADPESDSEDYAADETVAAGYGMVELFFGSKLVLVPGIRYERTSVNYTGNVVLFDADGEYESTLPINGKSNSGVVLPGLHLRYAFNDSTNFRAAYSRTLARPNYYDLVPYQLVKQEDNEIARGNSSLVPTVSDNLDLLFEHYFQSVGVISGGVFFKRLDNYIFNFRTQEVAFGDNYEITQPRNGDNATLRGVELSFQNQLRFLPAPFDGLGIYGNYTFTDSTARFPDRAGTSALPFQSGSIGNIAVSYEKRGFLGKVSFNFHGKFISEVGETAADDVYYDNHNQIDLNFSQRLTKNAQLYADFLNLTNEPLRYYLGSANRPIQEEYYRWWSSFGVRFNF